MIKSTWANFSLTNPLSKLTLSNQKGEQFQISFGVVNPIDNSTYVKVHQRPYIFQISGQQLTLDALDLADFIDSKVFTESVDKIVNIDIYRTGRSKKAILSLKKIRDNWVGPKNNSLSQLKVTNFLKQITSIKSQMILDEKSNSVQKIIDQYTKSPLYTIYL